MAKRVSLGNYIGGEWRGARSGETYEKRNPMRPDEIQELLHQINQPAVAHVLPNDADEGDDPPAADEQERLS